MSVIQSEFAKLNIFEEGPTSFGASDMGKGTRANFQKIFFVSAKTTCCDPSRRDDHNEGSQQQSSLRNKKIILDSKLE